MGRSAFILFVDLTKAFDLAIREFVLGWQQNFDKDPKSFLMGLGLSEEHAQSAALEVNKHGGLLNELGLNSLVVELIRSLHTNSWFQYADLDTFIVANKGGRQGCKLGCL